MPKLSVFGLFSLVLVGLVALAGHLGIAIWIIVVLLALEAVSR